MQRSVVKNLKFVDKQQVNNFRNLCSIYTYIHNEFVVYLLYLENECNVQSIVTKMLGYRCALSTTT